MEKILLMVLDTEVVNQPAISTALQGIDAREFITGSWLIKTNITAQDFSRKVSAAVGEADFAIIEVDRAALQKSVLPDEVTSYLGLTRAA